MRKCGHEGHEENEVHEARSKTINFFVLFVNLRALRVRSFYFSRK